MNARLDAPLQRIAQWDGALVRRLNRVVARCQGRALFCAASRLGDGVFWYALMLALLLEGAPQAVQAVAHMILAGLSCTLVYKLLKGGRCARGRTRPTPVS